MKKSLRFETGMVLLLISVITSNGQTILLAENFQGFSTGSHTTPSTSDASASLDSKTSVPGWTGALVYSAGGEIKIGTSTNNGWIETPPIDLSQGTGKFTIGFDIARWAGDATTVQVYINGTIIGGIITPGDNYQKVEIVGTGGISASKIRIAALTKRFFLDNFSVSSENVPTDVSSEGADAQNVKFFPVPAINILTISNIQNVYLIEIHDITGKRVYELKSDGATELQLDISTYRKGVYFVTLRSADGIKLMKFMKI
jgi:hypothetical protein